jgi:hypothetical protein
MNLKATKKYAQHFYDELHGIKGQTARTRWVWFLRHCFSCSNERDNLSDVPDAVRAFFTTLFKNSKIRLQNLWRLLAGGEELKKGSKRQNEIVRSKMINPFCERMFLPDSYAMGRRIKEETHNFSMGPFFLHSSKLARAMQTALLVGAGLKEAGGQVKGGLRLLPFIMEKSNWKERRKIRRAPSKRRATQNITTSKDACVDRNILARVFGDLAGGAADCKGESETPIIVKNLAKSQGTFFGSKAFRSLKDKDVGTNIVVSHGGFLRNLLLQTIVRPSGKIPHPRNAEAFLCEVVSLVDQSSGQEKVKAIFVRAQLAPEDARAPDLPPEYDVGQRCERIGSGSCQYLKSTLCDQGLEGKPNPDAPESDLIASKVDSYHSNRAYPTTAASVKSWATVPLMPISPSAEEPTMAASFLGGQSRKPSSAAVASSK